jgi:hypothetical protein
MKALRAIRGAVISLHFERKASALRDRAPGLLVDLPAGRAQSRAFSERKIAARLRARKTFVNGLKTPTWRGVFADCGAHSIGNLQVSRCRESRANRDRKTSDEYRVPVVFGPGISVPQWRKQLRERQPFCRQFSHPCDNHRLINTFVERRGANDGRLLARRIEGNERLGNLPAR